MEREAARHRRRHTRQYQEDADDRRRRKEDLRSKQEKANLAAIQAAEALKGNPKLDKTKDGDMGSVGSRSKKKATGTSMNGNKRKREESDDEASYDSIDEEEQYYQEHYKDNGSSDSDEEEEDEDTLILRDLARPLEAWDFHVAGKEGMFQEAEIPAGDDGQSFLVECDEDEEDGQPREVRDRATSPVLGMSSSSAKGSGQSPENKKKTSPKPDPSPVPSPSKNGASK
jgi:hypothetical protein